MAVFEDSRGEEAWHPALEEQALVTRAFALAQSVEHDKAGYRARKKHLIYGLPGPIIGVAVACVSSLWDQPESQYLVAPLAAVGAILTTIHTFMNMGGKAQQHWTYNALYRNVADEISALLSRQKQFREVPDAFMARVNTMLNHYKSTAPQLPGTGCCSLNPPEDAAPMPEPVVFRERAPAADKPITKQELEEMLARFRDEMNEEEEMANSV